MAFDDTKSPGDLIDSAEYNNLIQDLKAHAARHKDGGVDELDAAELAADLGNAGQVLQSDGAVADWVTLTASDVSGVSADSSSSAHHSKTDSASDLTDVSADSVSDAHHTKFTNTDAQNAVTGSVEVDNLNGNNGTSGQLLQTDGTNLSFVDFQSGSDVSDNGSLVVSAPSDVNFGNQLNVTDDGDGTVTVDASGGTSTKTGSGSIATSGTSTVFVDNLVATKKDGFEDGDFTSNPTWDFTSFLEDSANVSDALTSTNPNDVLNGSVAVELTAQCTTDPSRQLTPAAALTHFNTFDAFEAFEMQVPVLPEKRSSFIFGLFNKEVDPGYDDSIPAPTGGSIFVANKERSNKVFFVSTDNNGIEIGQATKSLTLNQYIIFEIKVNREKDRATLVGKDTSGTELCNLTIPITQVQTFDRLELGTGITNGGDTVNGPIAEVFFDDVTYDVSSADVTLSSSDVSDGNSIKVVDITGNAGAKVPITVNTEGNETINGENDAIISNNFEGLTFQSDGSDWYIVSRMSGGGVQ